MDAKELGSIKGWFAGRLPDGWFVGVEVTVEDDQIVVLGALPEIDLGLIPGAGGTVSVTRRIGRHRTALLALSGQPIDAETALSWGLVDELAQ